MEEKSPNEELIDQLIKKRKLEIDAFVKLLHAIKDKNPAIPHPEKATIKSKK